MQLQEFLARFDRPRKQSGGYKVRCPAHDDNVASLSVREGDKGIILYCHAGCDTDEVLRQMGLEARDLFWEPRAGNGKDEFRAKSAHNGNGHAGPAQPPRPPAKASPALSAQKREGFGQVVATYDYRDEDGNLLYQVVRFEPKDFRQRRPDPEHAGKWLWNLQETRRVLYRLPELLASDPDATVWIVEGEKDADRLASLGAVATSNVGGAGKWKPEYAETLRGRDVVILPDNDEPGRKHARQVHDSLFSIARSVMALHLPELPEKGDVSDWLQIEGNDLERLCTLAEAVGAATATYEQAQELMGEPTPAEFWRRTHEGLAAELVVRAGGNLKWVADLGRDFRGDSSWAWWTGKQWVFDARALAALSDLQRGMTLEFREFARDTIKSVGGDTGALDAGGKEILRFSKEIENNNFKNGWRSEVKSRPEIHVSIANYDQDKYLLACKNGVLDLRQGKLIAFSREHMLSKSIPIDYHPDASAPRWLSFLDRVFAGNENLIEFMARAIGYTLTGDTGEQCLFLCHGPGQNGKSKLLETIAALLGEFAAEAPMATFLAKQQQNGATNDLAMLRGARYVTATETNEGVRLDEALVKKVTGQDRITARMLFSEFFSYHPQFKLWLAMNHKPTIRGVDNGIWRRIRLIPFGVIIPDEERDPHLLDKLVAELPGILAWAVRGCLRWQADGLRTPPEVAEATQEYRTEQDVLGAFIEEYCVVGLGYQAKSADLYHAYRTWAEDSGEYVMSQTMFGRQLAGRGFERDKKTSSIMRVGIGLKERR